jgi:pimeloyl-ACP methyl ester carboxylesterase
MSGIKHIFVKTNGIKMHVAETGDGFPVVFCHGFPEMWYSWRHQMKALAEAGFRAIAPDQRGYGETESPAPIEAYTQRKLVGDIVGMLDALGIGKCVIVGHDWGGMVAWNTALMARDSVERVIGVNTPFIPRAPIKPTDAMRAMAAGGFHTFSIFKRRAWPRRNSSATLPDRCAASTRTRRKSIQPRFVSPCRACLGRQAAVCSIDSQIVRMESFSPMRTSRSS